jgi:SAM-dependent methyltransferase
MHSSARLSGKKFFDRYWNDSMLRILEIGSQDFNGSLRDFHPVGAKWIGVDIESGPGVDLVITQTSELPFDDGYFDLVVASSVFEHDPYFWQTFAEMIRVVRDGGYIYINSPSNGAVHRYSMDVYRFYPDAGKALADWGSIKREGVELIESFIGEQDGDLWNDFCAVIGVKANSPKLFIHSDTPCRNIWENGKFLPESLEELSEDQLTIKERNATILYLQDQLNQVKLENQEAQTRMQAEHQDQLNQVKLENQEAQTRMQAEQQDQLNQVKLENQEAQTRMQAEHQDQLNQVKLENQEAQTRMQAEHQDQLNQVKLENDSLVNSLSWKITSPLRKMKFQLRRVLRWK